MKAKITPKSRLQSILSVGWSHDEDQFRFAEQVIDRYRRVSNVYGNERQPKAPENSQNIPNDYCSHLGILLCDNQRHIQSLQI